MRKFVLPFTLASLVILVMAGCLRPAEDTSCDGYDWETQTVDEVVCPGTKTCSCALAETCCVTEKDGEVGDATCTAAGQCADFSFQCDGPEDCGAAQVCCASMTDNGGSVCVEEAGCVEPEEYVLCRSDVDCAADLGCVPSGKGAHFAGVIGFCDIVE